MSPLRWCLLATHVPPDGALGGIVRYTVELMRALAARDDVRLTVVTTRGSADAVRDVAPAAAISTVPNAPVPLLSLAERQAPLVPHPAGGGFDVVHGTKHLIPARTSALTVLTVHDLLLLDRPQDFGFAKRRLLPGPYRASLREADLLLCVSDATRSRLAELIPGSTARSTTVPLATTDRLRHAVPREIAGLADRRFALVVGDPTPRKNLRTVLAAWPRVADLVPGAALAIAGPPTWGRTDVGARYDGLVARDAVVPLGHVSDAQLRWAYEHAEVVLCPSLAEGFGLPAAEALELGADVIISSDAALREVCAGRERAVLEATDVWAWAEAIVAAFSGSGGTASGRFRRTRSWADVAEDTVGATRDALVRRAGQRLAG